MLANAFCKLKEHRKQVRKQFFVLLALGAGLSAQIFMDNYYEKKLQHNSKLTGKEWVKELTEGHGKRMENNLGMARHVFKKFVTMLVDKGGIGHRWYMTPSEQVAIFLFFVVTNSSNHKVAERFQCSGDTISK